MCCCEAGHLNGIMYIFYVTWVGKQDGLMLLLVVGDVAVLGCK